METGDFRTLGDYLDAVRLRLPKAIAVELEAQGAAIETSAKSKFGGYQTGWKPLSESTKAERARQGFTPDDPLFRSGGLRDAVHHKVEGETVFIGVESGETLHSPKGKEVEAAMVMEVQEYGDSLGRVPPRPVFETVVLEDLDRHVDAFTLGVMTRVEL